MIMDVRYINPFIGAVRHLFKTMLDTDIVASKPSLESKDIRSSDVSAAIGFSGGASRRQAGWLPASRVATGKPVGRRQAGAAVGCIIGIAARLEPTRACRPAHLLAKARARTTNRAVSRTQNAIVGAWQASLS